MAIGKVSLQMGVDNKTFQKSLGRVQKQLKNSIASMKNIFIAAKLGSWLFEGARGYVDEYMAKVRQIVNFQDIGISKEISNQIFNITNEMEKLGYSADMANDAITQFITSGRSTALRQMGVYLDLTTQKLLTTASAQERLNWVLSEMPNKVAAIKEAMPENVRMMTEFNKTTDDLKKSLGATFLQTINSLVKAFGGLPNVMKTALISFAAYKSAMILGNVAIGISKSIAQLGVVWGLPIAIGMGVAALGAIAALGTGTGLAVSSLNNLGNDNKLIAPEINQGASLNFNNDKGINNINKNNININIKNDRFGQEIVERSGGKSKSVQTNFGS